MTAQKPETKVSGTDLPKSLVVDELEEYIRYQDEVLEKNAEEMKGAIEEQEQRLERLSAKEEDKTERLYSMEDLMETLDARLLERIEQIDTNIGERIELMDRKTDEYMEELAKSNAQWRNRLRGLNTSLASHAREATGDRWEERGAQREKNRHYRYGEPVRGEEVIWEEGVVEEEKRPAGAVDEEIAETRLRVKRVKKPRDTEPIPKEGQKTRTTPKGAEYYRKQPSPDARKPPSAPKATRPPVSGTSPRPSGASYSCPVCRNSLVFYDKYQRWWCRTCKKWR